MTELTQQELREVQLAILDRIDEFCRLHDLTYHLAFGTLLGAVRYGTYIPWDDDIDLTMPRDDYTRFCATFPAASPDLALGAPQTTDGWAYPYAKVSDRRTVVVEQSDLEHDIGVTVDVFPVDHCAPTPTARRIHHAQIQLLKGLLVLKSLAPRAGRLGAKTAVVRASKPLVRHIRTGALTRQISRTASAHAGKSNRVSVLVGPYSWDVDEATMASSANIAFEGRQVPAPVGHHDVLSAIYGTDYIEPPPEGKRVSHHTFTARWLE